MPKLNPFQLLQKNVSLKKMTTFKVGGLASYFFSAQTTDNLRQAIQWATSSGIPFFILGKGSNVIVSDDGFSGLVITLSGDFCSIDYDDKNGVVNAGGGVPLRRLGNALAELGWSGFEYMCCIPGTVGGAVFMNAGTKSGEIKNSLLSARVMTAEGEILELSANEMSFGNRSSILRQSRNILLSASFILTVKEPTNVIANRIRSEILERTNKQPRNQKNFGSVFKADSSGVPAWQYIEGAGLRGLQVGGAKISEEHVNWIVNTGQATATDVKTLIQQIQNSVAEKYGIILEREVIFVPDDFS